MDNSNELANSFQKGVSDTTLECLPNELFIIISEYLNGKDTARFMLTNKRLLEVLKNRYKIKPDYIFWRHEYSLGFYLTGGSDFLTNEDRKYLNIDKHSYPSRKLIDNFYFDLSRQGPRVLFCDKSNCFSGGYVNSTCICGNQICHNYSYKINPFFENSELVVHINQVDGTKLEPFFKGGSPGLIKGVRNSCKLLFENKDVGIRSSSGSFFL